MEFAGYYGDYTAFQHYLLSLSEEKYMKFSQALIPNSGVMLGVRVPMLRNVAKKITQTGWNAFLADAKEDTHEEILLQGFVIGTAKMEVEERLELLRGFVPKITNWAVCDMFCSSCKFVEKNRDVVFRFLQPYIYCSQEFYLRFAVVMLMDYFITQEYVDKVLQILDSIRYDGYYTKMAQAWAISVCYVKFPEKTMVLLQNSALDDWTYNKALQKITESLRVDAQSKKIIRAMKRVK